jgi:hypothetical protein
MSFRRCSTEAVMHVSFLSEVSHSSVGTVRVSTRAQFNTIRTRDTEFWLSSPVCGAIPETPTLPHPTSSGRVRACGSATLRLVGCPVSQGSAPTELRRSLTFSLFLNYFSSVEVEAPERLFTFGSGLSKPVNRTSVPRDFTGTFLKSGSFHLVTS